MIIFNCSFLSYLTFIVLFHLLLFWYWNLHVEDKVNKVFVAKLKSFGLKPAENHSDQLGNLKQAFMFPFESGSVIGDLRNAPHPIQIFQETPPLPLPLPLKLQKQPRITYKGTVNNLVCERRRNNCNVC